MRFGGVVPCGILLVAGLRVLSGGRCTTVAFVLSVAGRFPLGVISLLVYLSLWVNSNTWGQQCQEGREKIINPPLGDGAGLWGGYFLRWLTFFLAACILACCFHDVMVASYLFGSAIALLLLFL